MMEFVPADHAEGQRMRRIAELRKLAEANADVRLSQVLSTRHGRHFFRLYLQQEMMEETLT